MRNIFTNNINKIKDNRKQRSDLKYSFSDIILGAFSMFYFQSKSWLSYQNKMQTQSGNNNARTLFGIENIPVNNHIKNILDKIDTKHFKQVYDDILVVIEQIGILKEFVFMKEYLLVAIDGVYYHSSQKVKCKCCQN
jgi:hypothetical protein